MIGVFQRVSQASVAVEEGRGAGHFEEIGKGIVALVGVERGDDEALADWMAGRIASLRMFTDAEGKMNLDVREVGGAALVISQFTLAARTRKGTRPSFASAESPDRAEELIGRVCATLAEEFGVQVKTGVFGAAMRVSLVNEGPVTLIVQRGGASDING